MYRYSGYLCGCHAKCTAWCRLEPAESSPCYQQRGNDPGEQHQYPCLNYHDACAIIDYLAKSIIEVVQHDRSNGGISHLLHIPSASGYAIIAKEK